MSKQRPSTKRINHAEQCQKLLDAQRISYSRIYWKWETRYSAFWLYVAATIMPCLLYEMKRSWLGSWTLLDFCVSYLGLKWQFQSFCFCIYMVIILLFTSLLLLHLLRINSVLIQIAFWFRTVWKSGMQSTTENGLRSISYPKEKSSLFLSLHFLCGEPYKLIEESRL